MSNKIELNGLINVLNDSESIQDSKQINNKPKKFIILLSGENYKKYIEVYKSKFPASDQRERSGKIF